jgi:hypothetical protein
MDYRDLPGTPDPPGDLIHRITMSATLFENEILYQGLLFGLSFSGSWVFAGFASLPGFFLS